VENQLEVTEEKADQAQETEQVEEASRPAPEEGGTSQGNVDSQPSVGQESEVAEATPLVESNEVNAPADDACVEDAPANTTANGPVDNEVLITCCLWGGQWRFHAGPGGIGPFKSWLGPVNLAGRQIVAGPLKCLAVLLTHCGQLILGKISKFDATKCQILRLKCTKFNFRLGSAPDPAGGPYSAPQTAFPQIR